MFTGSLILCSLLVTGLLALAIYFPIALHNMNKEWSKLLAAERTRDSDRLVSMYKYKDEEKKHLLMLLSAKHLTEYGQVLNKLETNGEPEPEPEPATPFPTVEGIRERIQKMKEAAVHFAEKPEAASEGSGFLSTFIDREVN